MENTLFIGNGLNQCLSEGVPWGKLLEEIAYKKLYTSYNSKIEMPLEFERIVNEYLGKEMNLNLGDRSGIYDEVKQHIKSIIEKVQLSSTPCIHKEIPFDKADNIITTNYDTLLEDAFSGLVNNNISSNTKYLVKATSQSPQTKIYHAHGIKSNPKSICLGYEHYMGMVETLRNKLNSETGSSSKKDMRICRILKGIDKEEETWAEKFYTTNIAFIGFGLSDCESDIWWLLTHRAFLFYSNYNFIQESIKNKIVFYDIMDNKVNNKDEDWRIADIAKKNNKHELLKKLHVDVKLFDLNDGERYQDKYKLIFNEIAEGKCWV